MTTAPVVHHGAPPAPPEEPSTALQTQHFNMDHYLAGLLSKGNFDQQRQLMMVYDQVCENLLGPNDLQRGEGGKVFKKKSAWRKLGRYFGISVTCDPSECRFIHMENGEWVAIARAVATSPWGQVWEDVGACGSDEETGRRKITLADAIGTAMTRASNRAVSNLIAMGEVSAEEMEKEGAEAPKPGDMIMPIGQRKGDPIGGIDSATLYKALEWIEGDEKRQKRHAKLAGIIHQVLDERGPEEQQQEAALRQAIEQPATNGAEPPAAPQGNGQQPLAIDPNDPRVPPPETPDPNDAPPAEQPALTAEGHTTSAQDGLPFDPE